VQTFSDVTSEVREELELLWCKVQRVIVEGGFMVDKIEVKRPHSQFGRAVTVVVEPVT
jgi:hypothetical protein